MPCETPETNLHVLASLAITLQKHAWGAMLADETFPRLNACGKLHARSAHAPAGSNVLAQLIRMNARNPQEVQHQIRLKLQMSLVLGLVY